MNPWQEVSAICLPRTSRSRRARRVERGLRRKIFTAGKLHVDEVLSTDFHVNRAMEGHGYGVQFKEEIIEQGAEIETTA